MRKRIAATIVFLVILLCFCSCSKIGKNSSFSIRFIDVGQGDAALVECDGHYMLIDGGDKKAGGKVYRVLQEENIKQLDILAISHCHEDHYGGLCKALEYPSKVGVILSNVTDDYKASFIELKNVMIKNGYKIKVPSIGDTYKLGGAEVEVVDVSSSTKNDSLVLLITYGKTRFLFTGDIEEVPQKRISDKYQNDKDEPFKIDVMKMPHHGAHMKTLYRFIRTFMPDYAIISVGKDKNDENKYKHPDNRTLDLLESADVKKVYRTDKDGDIIVKSNGKEVLFETISKKS